MSARTQLNLFIVAMGLMSAASFWFLISKDMERTQFVSQCVLENQTLPNPHAVCTAKFNLRGSK